MTKQQFAAIWFRATGHQLYYRSETVRPVEEVTLETVHELDHDRMAPASVCFCDQCLGGAVMSAKHTPGPWRIGGQLPGGYRLHSIVVRGPEGHLAAAIPKSSAIEYEDDLTAQANARLIAAAPELLAALQMVCDSGVSLADPIERAMLDAITKAEQS